MKRYLFFLLVSISFSSFGQTGSAFKDAEKQGISIEKLDKEYPAGVLLLKNAKKDPAGIDPQEAYYNAYVKMLQDFGKFLKKNDFIWENRTNGFNRIYFNPDGSIAYFLYNFKPDQLSPEKEKQFDELLKLFIKDYHFDYPMNTKFAQCSPVTFTP